MLLSQLRHHEFRKYSSNHILKVYKASNQSVVKNGSGKIPLGKFPPINSPLENLPPPGKFPPRYFPPGIFLPISLTAFLHSFFT